MTHQVLVVGHADADGHMIAEQVRRNLAMVSSFEVRVVVDPSRTVNHKAWMHLDAIGEIDEADYVFFVDLMFGPITYAQEARALSHFVQSRPEKRFYLIDHHPLPLERLASAENLRVIYRSDVAECAIGPRSGMMVVAALCEKQPSATASEVKDPLHEALALGMKRAAALGGPLPGDKLLALLRADQWDGLLALGRDDPQFHYLPRGRRPRNQPYSKLLKHLDQSAVNLLGKSGKRHGRAEQRGTEMAYDADIGKEQLVYDTGRHVLLKNVAPSAKDLGVIVTLIEVAALSLTTHEGATFTLEQLISEAREIGGEGIDLDEKDVRIVLLKATFIEKVGKEFRLK